DAVVRDAASINGDKKAMLDRLVGAGGAVATRAAAMLEQLGFIARERIDAAAARFRETGSREALSGLYDVVITRFREGVEPIERLRAMLGEPTETRPGMF